MKIRGEEYTRARERERVGRKKIQARKIFGKSRNTVFSNDLRVGRVEK